MTTYNTASKQLLDNYACISTLEPTEIVVGQNSLGKVGGMGYNNMNVMGLQLVVDNNFASGTMLVVYAPGFEIYEAQQGLLSVALPSTLARNFSYYGYFATFVAKSSFIQGIVIA